MLNYVRVINFRIIIIITIRCCASEVTLSFSDTLVVFLTQFIAASFFFPVIRDKPC